MPGGRTAAPPRDDGQRQTAPGKPPPSIAHMRARLGSQTQAQVQGSIKQRSQAPAPPASERRAEHPNAPAF